MKDSKISFDKLFTENDINLTAEKIEAEDNKEVFTVTAKVDKKEFTFKNIAGFRLEGDVLSDMEIKEIGPEMLAIRRIRTLFQLLNNIKNLFNQFDIEISGKLEQK